MDNTRNRLHGDVFCLLSALHSWCSCTYTTGIERINEPTYAESNLHFVQQFQFTASPYAS